MEEALATPPDPLHDPVLEPMDIGPAPSGSNGVEIVSAVYTLVLSIVPAPETRPPDRRVRRHGWRR